MVALDYKRLSFKDFANLLQRYCKERGDRWCAPTSQRQCKRTGLQL
ncbi:hypothetical protein CKA32_003586 [Geitlerinema sp. FC II]|nr:hypothetical protein CKA32_003586 [Geitlerinema sp. FC II]